MFEYIPFDARFAGLFSLLLAQGLECSVFSLEFPQGPRFTLLRKVAFFLLSDSENLGFTTPFLFSDTELTGIFSKPELISTKKQLDAKYGGHFSTFFSMSRMLYDSKSPPWITYSEAFIRHIDLHYHVRMFRLYKFIYFCRKFDLNSREEPHGSDRPYWKMCDVIDGCLSVNAQVCQCLSLTFGDCLWFIATE